MSEAARNKATFGRLHDAVNTGDAELIAKTIDEIVEPAVLIRTPLPIDATGAQALKHVWTTSRTAGSPRPGESSTSSRRCDSSASAPRTDRVV